MTELLTQFQRMKRKVDVWLFLYEDNGEVLPKSVTVGYYAYYGVIGAISIGLSAVVL